MDTVALEVLTNTEIDTSGSALICGTNCRIIFVDWKGINEGHEGGDEKCGLEEHCVTEEGQKLTVASDS